MLSDTEFNNADAKADFRSCSVTLKAIQVLELRFCDNFNLFWTLTSVTCSYCQAWQIKEPPCVLSTSLHDCKDRDGETFCVLQAAAASRAATQVKDQQWTLLIVMKILNFSTPFILPKFFDTEVSFLRVTIHDRKDMAQLRTLNLLKFIPLCHCISKNIFIFSHRA